MKAIIFFFSTLNVIALNAQESGTKRDSVIAAGPNELYFNVGPMLSMVQGAFAYSETNLAFMYKRVLKNPRFALRTGIAWKAESENKYAQHYYRREPNTGSGNSIYWYFDQTDTSRTKNYLDEGLDKKLQLNLGFEHRSKAHKRLSGFSGMDVVAGLLTERYALYDVYEVAGPYGEWYVDNRNDAIVLLDYQKSNSFYFGVSPKIGLSYSISPHWAISAQVAVLATLSFKDSFSRTPDGKSIVQSEEATTFDFEMNGIIDEINLVFRF